MTLELLGDNCRTCQKLRRNIKQAVKSYDESIQFLDICEPRQFAEYGLLSLPGVVINGQVKSAGKLLSIKSVIEILDANNKVAYGTLK